MNLNLGHIHGPLSQRECVFAVPGTRLYTLELGFGGHDCELKPQVEALCDFFLFYPVFLPLERGVYICKVGFLLRCWRYPPSEDLNL